MRAPTSPHFPPIGAGAALNLNGSNTLGGATTIGTGATLALGGKDVVVVDGDLRRPRVHTYFGLPNNAGLSTVVSRKTTLAEALQTYELPLSDWQAGGNGAQPTYPSPSRQETHDGAHSVSGTQTQP